MCSWGETLHNDIASTLGTIFFMSSLPSYHTQLYRKQIEG